MKLIAAGFGRRLDLLVCNAGVLSGRGGLQDPEQDSRNIEDTLMTNVGGVFFPPAFLPHLLAGSKNAVMPPADLRSYHRRWEQHPLRQQRHYVPC